MLQLGLQALRALGQGSHLWYERHWSVVGGRQLGRTVGGGKEAGNRGDDATPHQPRARPAHAPRP